MATNDARMEIRLPEAEKQAVFAGADAAGQNPSVWARRVFAAALANMTSRQTTCGRAIATIEGDDEERLCELDRGYLGPHRSPERDARKALETAPSEANAESLGMQSGPTAVPSENPQKGVASDGVRPTAQSRTPTVQRARRSDVGPKPASASRPRPKSKPSKRPKGGKT